MAEINDDMAKFARMRDLQSIKPHTSVENRKAKAAEEDKKPEKAPLVQGDQLTLQPTAFEDDDITPMELDAFVQQLKDMPDIREERVEEVLAALEEDGYDPDIVLPPLVDNFIEEEL